MASTAQEAHLPALGHQSREEVGRELQATLVELVDLEVVRDLEKQLWMLRASLPAGGA